MWTPLSGQVRWIVTRGTVRTRKTPQRASVCVPWCSATPLIHRRLPMTVSTPSRSCRESSTTAKPPEQNGRSQPMRADHAVVAEVCLGVRERPQPVAEVLLEVFHQYFPTITSAKRACRRGELLVDGETVNNGRHVHGGEKLEILQRVKGGAPLDTTDAPELLEVVYEDDDLAVVVKPQGMPMEGGRGGWDFSRCILFCLKPSSRPGVLFRPHYCHRLDAETGGLVLVAKTRPALKAMTYAFTHREIKKRYVALVAGQLQGQGRIHEPLGGKSALTEWVAGHQTRSQQHGYITSVSLYPHTGRHHQLRCHMASIGHPIVGDRRYTGGYAKCREGTKKGLDGVGDPRSAIPATSWAGALSSLRDGGSDSGGTSPEDIEEEGLSAQALLEDLFELLLVRVGWEVFSISTAAEMPDQGITVPPTQEENSANIVRMRMGRGPDSMEDPDALSAATAIQRLQYDMRAQRASEFKARKSGAEVLLRPKAPSVDAFHEAWGDEVPPLLPIPSKSAREPSSPRTVVHSISRDKQLRKDADALCLWAVEVSLTHPTTLEALTICIPEPLLFANVQKLEMAKWMSRARK